MTFDELIRGRSVYYSFHDELVRKLEAVKVAVAHHNAALAQLSDTNPRVRESLTLTPYDDWLSILKQQLGL